MSHFTIARFRVLGLIAGVTTAAFTAANGDEECIPNPEYPMAVERFAAKCSALDQEHVDALRELVKTQYGQGATRGAMGRGARRWCKARGLSDQYEGCVAAIVNVESTPEYMVRPDPPAELPEKVTRYKEASKNQSQEAVGFLRKRIDALRRQDARGTKKGRRELRKKIQELMNEPFEPKIGFGDAMAVGQIGSFGRHRHNELELVEILTEDQMLLSQVELVYIVLTGRQRGGYWETQRKGTVLVKGIPTHGLTTGKKMDLKQVFDVTGTTTYGANTIFVLEALAPDDYLSGITGKDADKKRRTKTVLPCHPQVSE